MGKVFTITEGLQNLGALKTGGQGSVYKARRTGDVITAVKLLPTPIHSESPTDKHYTAFQNEVQKLIRVNEIPNPNVVKIVSSGITDTGSLPFIEMEFIEGPDLEELLQPPHAPVFTIKETIRIAEQLSNALSHCHKQDVRHGDIKSNNVKYNVHTNNYVLLDFGLAVMSDEQRRTSLRHAGAIEFMAPEQADGKMLFQTDIYGFGVIIFELLAGQVPFPLRGSGEHARNMVMLAHRESSPPDIIDLRRNNLPDTWSEAKQQHEMEIPDWLLHLVYTCLEKNPDNRFAHGMELHDFVVRKKILTNSKNEWSAEQVKVLRQENERLLREKKEMEEQLTRYRQQPVPPPRPSVPVMPMQQEVIPEWTSPRQKRSSFQSFFLPFILTLLVIAAIVFFALKEEDNTNSSPISNNGAEKPQTSIGQFKVLSARAYFHNEPDSTTRRSAYMIPSNDIIAALEERNGFVYTEFTNSKGQTSKGWLRRQDLITLEEWTADSQATQIQAKPGPQDIANQLQEAKNLLLNNEVQEALYIYSYLAAQGVPEAMYQYGNLALMNRNNEIDCGQAIMYVDAASEKGYAPAKRTLGFLYIFAENPEVLRVSNYHYCTYEKDVFKGTQLLIQAIRDGDSTAKEILEEINMRRMVGDSVQ